MKKAVYGLIVLLAVLHQDFWWWDDSDTLLMGFLPITLAYHAFVSLAAGILWALAAHYCWPAGLETQDGFVASGGEDDA